MTSAHDEPVAVDLNADVGELDGLEGESVDDALLAVVTSASVACGGHAGDLASMLRVCTRAATSGVAVGAHLSYPDREGFGRQRIEVDRATLAGSLTDQLAALDEVARGAGTSVTYVKPHGALYHACDDDGPHAAAVLDAVLAYRRARGLTLPVLHRAGTVLARLADVVDVPLVTEGFPDRGYGDDGRLLPRTAPGAVLGDPATVAAQATRLLVDGVEVGGGARLVPRSLCLHSDSLGAAANARAVRSALEDAGAVVTAFAPPPPPSSGRMGP